jgi:hypothetical protein
LVFVIAACGGSSAPPPPTPPTVTSVSPSTALWGAQLTITGADFGAVQGTSRVVFPDPIGANGFQIDMWSDTAITGRVEFPATGSIGVMTDGGTASTMFTTMEPYVPTPALDVVQPLQEIVLSTGDVAGLFAQYQATPDPTLGVFSGSAAGSYPLADLVDSQDPTAAVVAQLVEADDHGAEVLGTKPDGSVGAFTISGGALVDTPVTTASGAIDGNVVAAGRDTTGLYAWIETETGLELAREGTPWTAGSIITTTYPPVAGAVGSDGTLWIVVSEPGGDGTSSYVSVETLASGSNAFGALEETDTMTYPGDIVAANIQVASDGKQAVVSATASGNGTPMPTTARQRSTTGTWADAPTLTGLVQYAFFGTTLGAAINDQSTSKTTSIVPDATMASGAQVVPVWPAQISSLAVDGSGNVRPIVGLGEVEYALAPSP